MKKLLNLLLVVVGAIGLTGCVTPGKPFQVVQPIPGKGVLYVYNDLSRRGPCEVLINDGVVGCLRGKDYLAFQCQPGPVSVGTGWETEINNVTVNVETGRQYYVTVSSRYLTGRAVFSLGLAPDKFDIRPRLVTEQEAMGQLKRCGLVESGKGLADELWGKVTPGTDLGELGTIYVDAGEKESKTAPFLVAGLIARGYQVKSGRIQDMPPDTRCVVKIREHWFWDLGTYLLRLEVEFLNPQTNTVYASANVRRAEVQGRRDRRSWRPRC